MDIAQRYVGRAVSGGPRVLVAVAVAVAVAAQLTDRTRRLRPAGGDCGEALAGDCPDVVPLGVEAARRALADPVERELADA